MFDDERKKSDPPLTAEGFERRKRFSRFTAADAALLGELREVFDRHADETVDRFYGHLMRFEEMRALLGDSGRVERLKHYQRNYLLSLASGRYDEEFAQDRRKIGQVHSQAGVEPQWYLGMYGLYLELLLPLIHERFGDDVRGAVQTSVALSKVMILDMQLVLDAYYGIRQKQALEKTEQLAAVGELAASIAHEVRNPLAGMKGALEVLGKELDASHHEIVLELLAQIERLENLVRDLLTYARPRALQLEEFETHELLDRLIRIHKEQCEEQEVSVERDYDEAAASLNADPRQIEQVFINLIHNALQAMTDGGKLKVVTRAVDGAIEVTFEDTGKGIPPGDQRKVLQPFFTTKHRGSGLGLPIVKKIAEAHGGRLVLESRVDRGTSVSVVLPTSGNG
jgi:signal transduction histidine kinase